MTPMRIIRNAYEYILTFENWTQEYYNKYRNGEHAPRREGECFCAVGALSYPERSMPDEEMNKPFESFMHSDYSARAIAHCTLMRMSYRVHGKHMVAVNDDKSVSKEEAHRNVLKVYEAVLTMFKGTEPTAEFWADHEKDAVYAKQCGFTQI